MARTLRRSHAAHEGPRGIPGRAGALQAGPDCACPAWAGARDSRWGLERAWGDHLTRMRDFRSETGELLP